MRNNIFTMIVGAAVVATVGAAAAQSGGGGGSGSSGGGAAGAGGGAGGTGSAGGPSAGTGTSGTGGINPSISPTNAAVGRDTQNNSNPNPTLNQGGSGTSAQPATPGTNSVGTALPSGSSAGGTSGAGGAKGNGNGNNANGTSGNNINGNSSTNNPGGVNNRPGARVDGVVAQGPNKTGDVGNSADDARLNAKLKSICRGC